MIMRLGVSIGFMLGVFFSIPLFAGISKIQAIDGVITKIEGDRVTIVSQGRDIVVHKKWITPEQRKAGKSVSITVDEVLPAAASPAK